MSGMKEERERRRIRRRAANEKQSKFDGKE